MTIVFKCVHLLVKYCQVEEILVYSLDHILKHIQRLTIDRPVTLKNPQSFDLTRRDKTMF